MLGDILAAARASSDDFARWLETADPDLAERIVAAAAGGESLTGFARTAVAEFSEGASEEDWADLVSRLHNCTDPGRVCLATMVQWRLARIGGPTQGQIVDKERTGDERER
jgi:hypothetical protein